MVAESLNKPLKKTHKKQAKLGKLKLILLIFPKGQNACFFLLRNFFPAQKNKNKNKKTPSSPHREVLRHT